MTWYKMMGLDKSFKRDFRKMFGRDEILKVMGALGKRFSATGHPIADSSYLDQVFFPPVKLHPIQIDLHQNSSQKNPPFKPNSFFLI
jgi:hypothetical protein